MEVAAIAGRNGALLMREALQKQALDLRFRRDLLGFRGVHVIDSYRRYRVIIFSD